MMSMRWCRFFERRRMTGSAGIGAPARNEGVALDQHVPAAACEQRYAAWFTPRR